MFFDLAARGCSSRRPGLDALRQALADKRLRVLLVFATNRLFRKTYKALQFVEEEIVEQGGRCIFLQSRIDTAEGDRWRAFLNLHAIIDELGVGMYGDHVRAAHQGLFERGMVHGTLSIGYAGEDVAGELTKRKKSRQRIVVDLHSAQCVRHVFGWFVTDHVPISEIARRLNADPEAPSPRRSPSGRWTHRTVRNLLVNTCYRGFWTYGKTETKWQSKKDYARQVAREEPLSAKQFEHLRIVSDELWYAAQAKLGENERQAGRRSKDGNRRVRPKLLNGLFWCPQHNRALEIGGVNGRYMVCRDCRGTPPESRPLYTYLDRQLALQQVATKTAELIRDDVDLVERIIDAFRQEVEQLQQPDTKRLQQLKSQESNVVRSIEFAVQNLGETAEDLRLAGDLVRQLKRQRAILLAEIKQLEAAQHRQITVPDELQVRELISQLQWTLEQAARGVVDQDAGRVREILQVITGGRIELVQMGSCVRHGGWLQGRFSCQLLGTLIRQVHGCQFAAEPVAQEVTVDFRHPAQENEEVERAWQLYHLDYQNKEIAVELQCSRSKVTKLLKLAAQQHGVVLEDGRSRRGQLKTDKEGPPLYEHIAEDVKRLSDDGLLFHEIADQLQVSLASITKAWGFWHTSRQLDVPDGRTRRKTLHEKQVA